MYVTIKLFFTFAAVNRVCFFKLEILTAAMVLLDGISHRKMSLCLFEPLLEFGNL